MSAPCHEMPDCGADLRFRVLADAAPSGSLRPLTADALEETLEVS